MNVTRIGESDFVNNFESIGNVQMARKGEMRSEDISATSENFEVEIGEMGE